MLKHKLHKNICKAIIETLKTYKKTEYDDLPNHNIVKNYFIDMSKDLETALAFCPDNESLIELFEMNLREL